MIVLSEIERKEKIMIRHGFIRLNREFLNWQWYDDVYASRVFLHLLITANYEDREWKGITIKAGQRVVSLSTLASETGISKPGVQKVLERLEKSGEIERTVYGSNTVITLKNYGELLGTDTTGIQSVDDGDTNGIQSVAQCNNIINKKNNNINKSPRTRNAFSAHSPTFTIEMLEQSAYDRYRGSS